VRLFQCHSVGYPGVTAFAILAQASGWGKRREIGVFEAGQYPVPSTHVTQYCPTFGAPVCLPCSKSPSRGRFMSITVLHGTPPRRGLRALHAKTGLQTRLIDLLRFPGEGFRSRSISSAKHGCDAIPPPDFWGTGSLPLLLVPVSGTVYVDHCLAWDAPEMGAASFTCENRLAHTAD